MIGCSSSDINPSHSDYPFQPFLINPKSSGFPDLIIYFPTTIYAMSFYEANIIPKPGYITFLRIFNYSAKSVPYINCNITLK